MNRQRQLFLAAPRPALPPERAWTLVVSGRDGAVPADCRFKRWLKSGWRAYGLKVRTITGPPVTTAPPLEPLPATATPSPGRPSVPIGTHEARHARLIDSTED